MAFTGRALYDSGIFDGVAEDVSEEISMISPYETKLLDRLTQAPRPAVSVYHEWLEERLNPNTIVCSTAALGLTDPVTLTVHDGSGGDAARFFMVGHVFENETTGEQMQVTVVDGPNDLLVVSRGYGSTSAASIDAGESLFAISDVALEGADVTVDISRPRVRKANYCQIFKKDVIVSGTVEATRQLGNIGSEMDHQRNMRLRESLRDLEKATIRGKTSGNTLGSATARRSMNGILAHLTTNIVSIGSLNPSILDDVVKTAWDGGGTDLDLIVCDKELKKIIDTFNDTRVEVMNEEQKYRQKVSFFEGTFGEMEVQLNRYMPPSTLMVISTQRIHVVPLQGRSYRFEMVSKTGDAEKGMLLGEYTVEVRNEEGMATASI